MSGLIYKYCSLSLFENCTIKYRTWEKNKRKEWNIVKEESKESDIKTKEKQNKETIESN